MYIGRCGAQVEVWAPAKLNLFLEVLSRRSDGYHEIETLMAAINIFDTLYFVADSEREIHLSARWASGLLERGVPTTSERQDSGLGDLPEGSENIVVTAVELLRRRANVKAGARIRLRKRIPSRAGLGGASSNAAAALVAANIGWNLGWSRQRLGELAAEIGSDVPFFLSDGTAVCRGRGERIEPVAGRGRLNFVVVRPPEGLSTRSVYESTCLAAEPPRSVDGMRRAVKRGCAAEVGRRLFNRLQSAAENLSPWIVRLRDQFGRLGLLGHQMSGSGSSYFGICRNARHARRVAVVLRGQRLGRVHWAGSLTAPRRYRQLASFI